MTAINAIDFYKSGHRPQYPEGTESVYSTWTPRSTKHFTGSSIYDGKIVHFGIQAFVKDYLIEEFNRTFFSANKEKAVHAYQRRMDNALGKGVVTVEHIEALHDLGYLPIRVKSLPEGAKVKPRVATVTVKETIPEFFWLVNYIETVMSSECWKPSTVATIAHDYARLAKKFADETSDVGEFALPFQIHDFSFRGMSGRHDAAHSGMGHLLSSCGTDTVPAIDAAEKYYNADSDKEVIGTSVPATEHSVMCMGGKGDEISTFKRIINELYPSGIVSIVSDTWDFWKVVTEYLPLLKPEILNRKPNDLGLSKVVIRPDSGNPVDIICGLGIVEEVEGTDFHDISDAVEGNDADVIKYEDRYYIPTRCDGEWKDSYTLKEVSEAEVKGAIECLWDTFGGEVNSKGYRELNPAIGLIYGDSITIERAERILNKLKAKGFSSTNVVFGVGSYTYQMITRDTFGFAMKATAGVVNAEFREIFKDPATDDGTKKSARGFVRVELKDDDYVMYDQQTAEQEEQGCLRTIFADGKMVIDDNFSGIRKRLAEAM